MSEETYKMLAINPGSTSTKIAVYENENELFRMSIEHDITELSKYKAVIDQFTMRKDAILNSLQARAFSLSQLSAVSGRGGALPPLKQGAYKVNKEMVDYLKRPETREHASKLGALIAYEFSSGLNIPAYIYDSTSVDELEKIAKFSGIPDITRRGGAHVLNMRATTIKIAKKLNRKLQDLNIIVTHLGGGITSSVISGGKMIDLIGDDEGPFSPERAGKLPSRQLVDLCFSEQYNHYSATKRMRGNGGLVAYLNTNKALEVEEKIKNGDKYAELVYQAMAYQVAKGIGELATVTQGNVDVIILTGSMAYSKLLTDWIIDRVKFIGSVEIFPGENELEALAFGTLRVLKGEEIAHEFVV